MKTYHFYINDSPCFSGDRLVYISNFNTENLKIDKKNWKDLTIYYINYINTQFCLSISNVSRYISEENNEKFLINNEKDFMLILISLKDLIANKEDKNISFNDGYEKIKFLSDDSFVLNKLLYFTELIVVIRCVLKQEDLFYPQIYLGYGRYQL